MCTVTYLPTATGIILTSNRDERPERSLAVRPMKYTQDKEAWVCPKDRDAGGSWIAVKNNGDAAVLLNGAFILHQRRAGYRKSRGLVFLEMIRSASPDVQFERADLSGIEPFTLIIYSCGNLYECRWDGAEKYRMLLDATGSYIWSSATLYDETARNKRRQWFDSWRKSIEEPTVDSILSFHRDAGAGDRENGLLIHRPGIASTVSITSIKVSGKSADTVYLDLKNNRRYNERIDLKPLELKLQMGAVQGLAQQPANPPENLGMAQQPTNPPVNPIEKTSRNGTGPAKISPGLRKFLIKIRHWEYWPFHILYAPLYPYWLWLAIKARSFFFFSAANPSIPNAGFLLEKKKAIYDLMPGGSFPKTLFCEKGLAAGTILELIEQGALAFPLIAKPDIGERGVQVRLLKTEADLLDYARLSKVDFLLQEYIGYPHEAGIFYYRIPGDKQGHISGIVGKELLSICGDGRSTIGQLVKKEDRYALQWPVLQKTYGAFLETVPPRGMIHTLVPYGNHSRGAKFIDQTKRINDDLTNTIDALCRQIPGFYFGRLDIKYNSWDELCTGKNFSVIELNGAGSEPAHIYDPAHSIFFAWKEILKHWSLLYKISRLNAIQQEIPLMGTRAGLNMLRDHSNYLKLLF